MARPGRAVAGPDHGDDHPGTQPICDGAGLHLQRRHPVRRRVRTKHTDAPNRLEAALRNAPPGATVNGDVYWDVYRALVTNVVLTDTKSGKHLAQWNLWQPGAPLP